MADEKLVKSGLDKMDRLLDVAKSAQEKAAVTDSVASPMWLNELTGEALPSFNRDPKYHYCWLSTTNTTDPIYKRQRMGYELVSLEELPELEAYRSQGSQYENKIVVNEMILARIPIDVYRAMVTELHELQPRREEEGIRNMVEGQLDVYRDSAGRPLGHMSDGMRDLGAYRKPTGEIE